MTDVTYYVALPFFFSDDGAAAGEATECQRQCRGHSSQGALPEAGPRRGRRILPDRGPSSGDFSEAQLIRKFGDVPDDLSAL